MNAGITEVDIHGMTRRQAEVYVSSRIKRAGGDVYRIRVIHGYRGGTGLRDMIRSRYKSHPRVLRIEFGLNQGETDLVLREYV